VHRPEATGANGAARDHLVSWLTHEGFALRVDAVGNVFGLLDLAGGDAPLILTGSHIDSQPDGGRLDGTYGVVSAVLAAIGLRAEARAGRMRPRCNIGVVAWTNEEGARFQPSLLGSSVYAGAVAADWALDRRDGGGVSLGEALATIGYRGTDTAPAHPAAYVELHVECGPVLEAAGRRLGIFDRWWGCRKIELLLEGEAAHTGPTPMAQRRDALLAASRIIVGLREMADAAAKDALHTSVGRLELWPNSPNVVPARVRLFIELRSPEAAELMRAEAALQALIARTAADRITAIVVRDEYRRPGRFTPALQALAETVARGLGEASLRLDTVAAHDALSLARLCPSIVVATPSCGGLCHTPLERTEPADLELGLDLLTGMLRALLTADALPDREGQCHANSGAVA
jgi:N-carbamoyl-L-amino-acid hydrolase